MNRFQTLLLLTILGFSLFIMGCSNDDNGPLMPTVDFAPGVFIVNEGNFGSGNGSISFYHPETMDVSQDIFQAVNGRPTGDVVQSMAIGGDRIYVVANGSNTVEAVERGTFNSTATLTDGLANPRFAATHNDKVYVSNWGSFDENFQLDQSFVQVWEAGASAPSATINTDNGTENLMVVGDRLFASNSFTNTVSVIDLNTEEVISTLELYQGPGAMVLDAAGNLNVICTGNFQGQDGRIITINPNSLQITGTIELGLNPSNRLTVAEGTLFTIAGANVVKISPSGAPELVSIEGVTGLYGIDYDAARGEFYLGDAAGFQGNGKVIITDQNFEEKESFSTGVGPNGFVFEN